MRLFKLLFLIFLVSFASSSYPADQANFVFTVIKYGGGGDWYNGLSGVRHFLKQLNKQTNINASLEERVIELTNPELFYSPFIYINGHGNIKLAPKEVLRLRNYLEHGGFLFINDDYGLDEFIRREMKRVFPDKDFVELPFDHPIYHNFYDFPNGLPKIHEHHGGPPHGYGIYHEGRLVVFYNYNTDIADGWETEEVHHDPPQKREAAIKMGINIVLYALTH